MRVYKGLDEAIAFAGQLTFGATQASEEAGSNQHNSRLRTLPDFNKRLKPRSPISKYFGINNTKLTIPKGPAVTLRRITVSNLDADSVGSRAYREQDVLGEPLFHRMITIERKRTERSRKSFLLMLLDTGDRALQPAISATLANVISTLSVNTRETDVSGWYKTGSIVGVMFTEMGITDRNTIIATMLGRVSCTLRSTLTVQQFSQVNISFHLYPEDWDRNTLRRLSNPTLYPDLITRDNAQKLFVSVKRLIDIVGSGLALVLAAPVFAAIAIAIKTSSSGPVFFRQIRVGQHGIPFVLFKFRSMYSDCDARSHEEYVKDLIAGTANKMPSSGNGTVVYKLTKDPRVTPVGRLLRRTSLDELPQLVNVMVGKMSLVGPRPPIPYEVDAYDIWHRGRLLEAKPGLTGLWQVNGRSRVKFDDMVRLDLRYARTWSPWLDLKILLRTPRAVFSGDGAY